MRVYPKPLQSKANNIYTVMLFGAGGNWLMETLPGWALRSPACLPVPFSSQASPWSWQEAGNFICPELSGLGGSPLCGQAGLL